MVWSNFTFIQWAHDSGMNCFIIFTTISSSLLQNNYMIKINLFTVCLSYMWHTFEKKLHSNSLHPLFTFLSKCCSKLTMVYGTGLLWKTWVITIDECIFFDQMLFLKDFVSINSTKVSSLVISSIFVRWIWCLVVG